MNHIRLILGAVSFCVFALFAQEFRATLTGTVTDPSGAILPGVKVTATNIERNVTVSTISNEAGAFTFPPLIPGQYTITAAHAGFKQFVREGIVLRLQDKVDLPIQLEVGDTSTSVRVTGELPLVETATATTGQVIEPKLISELPLNGRNPYLLTILSVGVMYGNPPAITRTFDTGATNSFTTGGPATSGQLGNNEFILDGVPGLNFVPSVSATQEFKVQINTYDAEYGRSAGANVNVSTKSGTNSLHGEVYEFLRNSKLDSNNFFLNRSGIGKSVFQFNLFGASVGGPVIVPGVYNGKDKTFFFFNYEGIRQGIPASFLDRMPTDLERTGDFSKTLNRAGQAITIYDPLNPEPNPSGGFTRTPFAGDKIPSNRIDPVALKMIGYYPAANLPPQVAPGVPNFAKSVVTREHYDQYIVRVDHSLTTRDQFFVRLETSNRTNTTDPVYGNIAEPGLSPGPFQRLSRGAGVQNTHTFGPHAVLTTRYGYTRLVNSQDLVSQNFDFRTLGFPDSLYQQVPYKYFPPTSIDGYASLGAGGAFLNADDGHAFQSTFLYVRGKHSLKIGEDIRVTRSNRGHTQSGATSGTYSFNAAFTQGPNPNVSSSTAGIGFASFLLGTPASGQIDNLAEGAFQGKYYGLFVQDDIRLTSSLTMNLGLRWDYESPLTERFNNMNRGFDFNAVSPVQPPGMTVKGGLVFADANHRSQGDGQPTNFAPRVGLAWRLGSHSALRAGYGIFYGSTGNGVASSAVQAGFSASTSFVSSLDGGITPANYLHDPFPQGLVKATGSTLGLATFAGQSVSFVSPHFIRPYTQNYTLNIQREFAGHILVDLGYAGLRGTHLSEPQALQLDQLPPADLSLGTQLQSQVNNPFFGLISIGPLSAPKIALQQLLRPFPQFTSVTMLNPRIGNSTYHSFQAKVEHRFSGGLSFLTSYTLSKLIDDLNQLVGRQDNYNLKAERSLSEYDRTHRLVTTVVWELPIGRGKRFLNQSAVVDRLLGGWQADTIYQIQSGRPLPLTATPTTTVFGGGLRPNTSGGSAALDGRVEDRLNRFFNTSLFSVPTPFTFGNTGRTLPNVREPRLNLMDFSVIKNIHVIERVSTQFRAEFFNLFNHPVFGRPGLVVGSPSLGLITSQFNSPRQIQFALKIVF